MEWTDDQKQVISTRKRSILVSAAAGSGKTAVLVARILGLILDPDDPVDIDELLIVTFTRAAAGEMKTRIEKALAKEREHDPDNPRLADQLSLIHNAEITTIDGFCSRVVRDYGHTTGVTPGFRVPKEGEALLLKSDAARQTIEEAYAYEGGEKERFEIFADTFATGRNDAVLERMLIRVSDAADSEPDPEEWLRRCGTGSGDPSGGGFLLECLREIREKLDQVRAVAEENVSLACLPEGPSKYLGTAESDLALITELMETEDYWELRRLAESLKMTRLPSVKEGTDGDPMIRARFRDSRERIKKTLKAIRDGMYPGSPERAAGIQAESGRVIGVLTELTLRYRAVYGALKRRRNVMDFADLEHEALKILRRPEGRTEPAKELAGRYREILVDEYQDSNYLQEMILTAVSRIPDGAQNYFTVGDVKQSIYSFRKARPDLFMEKYAGYRENPGRGVRIDLHRNFRSRREVIDTVNTVFSAIMIPETGGICYDEDAMLVYGAGYPDGEGFETEVIPVLSGEKDEEGMPLLGSGADEKTLLEARAVGERILELVRNGRIHDDAAGGPRPVRFRDVAVLLRSVRGTADAFVSTLMSMGIPAYADTRTGYFDSTEVQAVLSFLEILDNPGQDIPCASVLRSGFLGLDAGELAAVGAEARAAAPEKGRICLWDAVRYYAESGTKAELRNRLADFLALYGRLRERIPYTAVHELVGVLLTETGYLSYASAMPGGAQRELNLRMLEDQALEYEKTSYSGLFNFIRYIRNLEKKEADPGELTPLSGSEDVVRICSIHKSKGLEFPVVFVSGLGRRFNRRSATEVPLIHTDLGIAADYVDLDRRVRIPTLGKMAAASRIRRDQVGEELRVLYVALTRAKQKLILTGVLSGEEALAGRLDPPGSGERMTAGYLISSACFFDWILPVCGRVMREAEKSGIRPCLVLRPVKPSGLAEAEITEETGKEAALDALRQLRPGTVFGGEIRTELERRFSFRYPYDGRENIPVEISVSEIKRRLTEDPDEERPVSAETAELYPAEKEETVPAFIRAMSGGTKKETHVLTPAERGTAFHRAMELLDYGALPPVFEAPEGGAEESGRAEEALLRAVREQIAEMAASGRMTDGEAEVLHPENFVTFLRSPLGQRMRRAALAGTLRREQPFVMAMPASSIDPAWPDDEDVFVQGIIDAYFREDGGLVLVDYKTDRAAPGQEEALARRYRVQLRAYREALERGTKERVTETFLWSAALGREIRAD